MEDEETEGSYYTNQDMLRMFHPNNKNLPHIYDALDWNHCDSGDQSDADTDVENAEFRGRLYDTVRMAASKRYRSKLEMGYSFSEKKKLNEFYDWMYPNQDLDNYESRPRF